jgi:hypothetical protein
MTDMGNHHQGQLDRRRTRIVAWALVALAALAVWGVAAQPLLGSLARSEREIAQLAAQVADLRQQSGQLPELAGRLAAVTEDRDRQALFLGGEDAPAAQEALRRLVSDVLEGAGLEIVSLETLATTGRRGSLTERAVRVRLRGELSQIHEAVYRLEAGRPLLIIANASLRVRTRRSGNVSPLEAELDVTGFFLSDVAMEVSQ